MRTHTLPRNVSLDRAMKLRGMTVRRLAEASETHPATVSRLLHARQLPRNDTAFRIAQALGTSPEALRFWKGGA